MRGRPSPPAWRHPRFSRDFPMMANAPMMANIFRASNLGSLSTSPAWSGVRRARRCHVLRAGCVRRVDGHQFYNEHRRDFISKFLEEFEAGHGRRFPLLPVTRSLLALGERAFELRL